MSTRLDTLARGVWIGLWVLATASIVAPATAQTPDRASPAAAESKEDKPKGDAGTPAKVKPRTKPERRGATKNRPDRDQRPTRSTPPAKPAAKKSTPTTDKPQPPAAKKPKPEPAAKPSPKAPKPEKGAKPSPKQPPSRTPSESGKTGPPATRPDKGPAPATTQQTPPAKATAPPTPRQIPDDQPAGNDQPEDEPEPPQAASAPTADTDRPADRPNASLKGEDPQTYYGLWVIAPALIAILLAMLTRQVVPAMFLGVLTGAYMMLPCVAGDSAAADPSVSPVIRGFRYAMEYVLFLAIADGSDDLGHLKIIIFTLVIGFTVGVIGRNGGTAGLVRIVGGRSDSPRRSALAAWFAGLVVFFDDYANTMIVGPTMRSVFDKAKLSRAKLAYIVDSTAAPVASLALIGTWIGTEIAGIQLGLDSIPADDVPAFLADSTGRVGISGMQAFIQSLPYRFYPILALVLVFFVSLLRRDFGPMKKAEITALSAPPEAPREEKRPTDSPDQAQPRWMLGFVPILVLVGMTIYLLIQTGLASLGEVPSWADMPLWERGSMVLSQADSYLAMYYGAFVSAIVAVVMTMLFRACKVRDAVDAGLAGMSRMFPAIVVLILAWSLATVLDNDHLRLGEVVATYLERFASAEATGFSVVHWLPLAVFATAAAISFATGTAWGTMAILCPMVVSISVRLLADIDPTVAQSLFYGSIGSVLAGAVFGDHCSPISDTTVLSSMAAGCRHEEHVWTQIPYAILTAVAAMAFGDVMCNVYRVPVHYALGAGAIFLLIFLLVFGRTPVGKIILPRVDLSSRLRGGKTPSDGA